MSFVNRFPAWAINGVAVTCGLALIAFSVETIGGRNAGQVALGIAVCASLADVVTTVDRIARRVLAALLGSLVASCAFLVVRQYGVAPSILAVAAIFFGAMLIQCWGTKAGSVSFATALALVFAMSQPADHTLTWWHVGWSICGAGAYLLWALVTSWMLQARWRTLSLLATLEDMTSLLRAVANRAAWPTDPVRQAKVVTHAATFGERLQAARDLAFSSFAGNASDLEAATVYELMRLREAVLASAFLVDDTCRQTDGLRRLAAVSKFFEGQADRLEQVWVLLRGARGVEVMQPARSAPSLRDAFRAIALGKELGDLEIASSLKEIAHRVNSIRSTVTASRVHGLPCRREDLQAYMAVDDWSFATLAKSMSLQMPALRHALRGAVAAGGAYAIAREIPWTPHPQWVVLTIAAVMQGNLALTLARRDARVLGTLFGCIVVALLTSVSDENFYLAYFLIASGVAHAFFGVRYAVTAGAAAVMAILQAYLAAPSPHLGIAERFCDTLFGALIGWAAVRLLPIWEGRRLGPLLAQAIHAVAAYVQESLKVPRGRNGHCPALRRQQAYDALGALLELQVRTRVEPRGVQISPTDLSAWLVTAYAVMSQLSSIRLLIAMNASAVVDDSPLAAALVRLRSDLSRLTNGKGAGEADGRGDETEHAAAALGAIPDLERRVDRLRRGLAFLVSGSNHMSLRLRGVLGGS